MCSHTREFVDLEIALRLCTVPEGLTGPSGTKSFMLHEYPEIG
jgi:hypothetical protein